MKLIFTCLFFLSLGYYTFYTTKKEPASLQNRIENDLIAFYQFKEGKGEDIADLSNVEPLIPLKITKNEKGEVSWVSGGGIRTNPSDYRTDKSAMQGEVSSIGPATKINNLIKKTGSFTVEIWAKPANVEQLGPVRLVSLSEDTGSRNLTVGHAAHAYDFRARTSKTNNNGLPSLRTKESYQAKAVPTHIVFTFSGSNGVVYIDGKAIDWFFFEGTPPGDDLIGDLSGWDNTYKLILGNEIGGARAWKGDIYLLAFYNRALTKEEIIVNLKAGY